MESLGDYLCAIFMTMFWIFRILVTALTYLQIEFPFVSMNMGLEIVLLFVTLICIICVFKRIALGGLVYCVMYVAYFGPDLYKNITEGTIEQNLNVVMVDFLAVVLACVVLLNIIISKTRKISNKKDVEWFYNGKEYDREKDERADKNNYRIY